MKKERIEEVTLLRAMAFMAITMQHCIAEYIYRPDIQQPDAVMLGMLFHFTRFGTPTFVFLTGVLLICNYTSKLNYGSFLRKRVNDIFVPFLTWTVIYWVAVNLFIGMSFAKSDTWMELGRQVLQPTYGYHLWFILMIFQFYLLLPLLLKVAEPLRRFIQRKPDGALARTMGLLFVAAISYGALMWFSYYKANASAAAIGGIWEWLMLHRTEWFIFYSFYFILGGVCAYGLSRFRQAAVGGLAASGLAFIGLYIWAGYELLGHSISGMKLGLSTYLRPSIFLLIVTQLMTAYGLAVIVDRDGGIFKRMLLFIGRHSYGSFLAHPFVLLLVSEITRSLPLSGWHLPVTAATFVVVSAGAIGISKAASMLPFGWLLVGTQGKRNDPSRNKLKSLQRQDRPKPIET